MSLQKTRKHLASIKVCDGIQGCTQPRVRATRRAHATLLVIIAYGMLWGKRSMSSKAETGLV